MNCETINQRMGQPGFLSSKMGWNITINYRWLNAITTKDVYPFHVSTTSSILLYYCCFVPGFAQIAALLHALTKENAVFHWTPECESAFSKLKQLLTTAPVLSYPVFGPQCEFILETDTSGWGLVLYLHKKQVDVLVHPVV